MESWDSLPWVQLACWKDWCVQALRGFERCFAFRNRGPQSWNGLRLSWTAQRILLLETADDHFLVMPTTMISFAFEGPGHVGLFYSRNLASRFVNIQRWRRGDLRSPGTYSQYLTPKGWISWKVRICCPWARGVSRLAPPVCKESVFRSTAWLPAGEPTAVITRTKDRLQRQIPLRFQRSWDLCWFLDYQAWDQQ